ncbi:MAG: penicillin acylase family protein, partial [Thiohalocapsa sp.]
ERDLAVALGLVHAHLRLAQIEFMRRIAWGRVAEALGPAAVPLDHAILALGITRAVPAIDTALPVVTRSWLDGFVAGINHHLATPAPLPPELRLLGLRPAPWQRRDVLAIARLAAADVNWLALSQLLRLRREHREDWPEIWASLVGGGRPAPRPPCGESRCGSAEQALRHLALGFGVSGSNAAAVAGSRSASGRPSVVGDTHLMLSLPSAWLIAACHAPGCAVAGLMIPGVPVVVIGRNRTLAWGGTNLLAASSELFDASTLPADQITERRVRLPVRWSPPREIVLRECPQGPIVSDAAPFRAAGETLALRWVGHRPSDEISALLAINRTADAAALRQAADGIAVPGQALVFADAAGTIGKLRAAHLPPRPSALPADIMSPPEAAAAWSSCVSAAGLPFEIDPPQGLVVSANETPPPAAIPIGWFFAPGDRAERLATLLGGEAAVTLAQLTAWQRDVLAPRMLALRERLLPALTALPAAAPLADALRRWDGRYDAASTGALAIELLLSQLIGPPQQALYRAVWHGRALLIADIGALPGERLTAALGPAVEKAARAFRRLRDWGGAHRLRLAHPLGRVPLLGRQFPRLDWPWPGGSDTLFNATHLPVKRRHGAIYGSNARYIFDLSDPDANRVVLLGGQDGVPGSAAFLDQAELFRRGEYLELPLDPATAAHRFPHLTTLAPAAR